MAVESVIRPTHKLTGAASDTKPTTAPVGAIFIEQYTGIKYIFADGSWVQILGSK